MDKTLLLPIAPSPLLVLTTELNLVRIKPGARQLTRMFLAVSSKARLRVRPRRAVLLTL